MARRLGVVDVPGGRRVNQLPVPRLGGLALFLGMLVPALAFLHVGHETAGCCSAPRSPSRSASSTTSAASRGTGSSAGRSRRPRARATGFGVWVDRFTFPFVGVHTLPSSVGIPLTILWIVAIMNMVNFLDGLDGLAAGVAAIAGLTFSVIALSLGKVDAAVLSAIVFGACVGFLRHNFYPARIFMGDSGALLLGYVLGAISVQGLLKTAATVALFFPLLVLAVPIVGHDLRRRAAAQARRARVRGRPGAPAPPLSPPRLLAAARGADDLGLVHVRSRRLRSRPASSPSAPMASGIRGGRCSPPRSAWLR